jgi:uncharacterized membrane protein YdjX (TVP38/TMEM64 family)
MAAGLAALFAAMALWRPVSEEDLRGWLDPLGWTAIPAFWVVSGLLGAALVPGPILAGASGLLFGTWPGFAATLGATVVTTLVAVPAGRAGGRAGVEDLDDHRVRAIEGLLRRHGVAAVVLQRLLPGVPDAPCSYLYGAAGLRLWQVVVGTVIGASPRALSYTALGDAVGSGDGGQAAWSVALLVLTGITGSVLAWVVLRRRRAGEVPSAGTEGKIDP